MDGAKHTRSTARRQWELFREAAEALDFDSAPTSILFAFARELRSRNPHQTGEAMADEIEEVFMYQGLPGNVWDALGLDDRTGDPRSAFITAFDQIRVPKGQRRWELVARYAKARPFIPLVRLSDKYVLFLSLAGHLQRSCRPGAWITLPVQRTASMLGVTPGMISIYRRQAVQAGILTVTQPHSHAEHRSTRFVFNLSRFDRHGRELPRGD
jgi:hypothetical protein